MNDGHSVSTEIEKILDALQSLHDYQNGPPLVEETKEWNAAMDETVRILRKYGRIPGVTI